MARTLKYDARIDAYVIEGEESLDSEADVAAWRKDLVSGLEAVGRKVYLLVDVAGFKISPAVSALYGETARDVAKRFALGVIRFNSSSEPSTTATIQIEAVVQRFPSNVCPDRESAEKALQQLRQLPPKE